MGEFYPQITQEVGNIITIIKAALGSSYEVYDEFNDRLLTDQLTKPTATVGIKSFKSEDRWFQDCVGVSDGERFYGKYAEVTYEVTIHSPVMWGGQLCRTFLCKLRDAFYKDRKLAVSQVTSGEIKYDRSRRCLYMPVDFVVKYIV